jgi:hypothetical protein
MSNYIKIPLSVNPPRSFKTQALTGPATWAVASGTLTAGTDVAAQDVVGGSGSAAVATIGIAVGATLGDVTATITTEGEGYIVGDIVTFAANTAGGGASEWDEPLAFTIVAADLIASEGATGLTYQLIPIDNVVCIDEDSATECHIQVKGYDGSAGPSKWTVTIDDTPAITKEELVADIAKAIGDAAQAENSQPTVQFTDSAECLTVVYS